MPLVMIKTKQGRCEWRYCMCVWVLIIIILKMLQAAHDITDTDI